MKSVIGIALLAVGAVLLYFGYQSWNAPVDQVVTAVTGNHTDNTMIYVIAGIAAVVGGASLVVFGRNAVWSSFYRKKEKHPMLGTVLLIVLILLVIGALPRWGYSSGWGYSGSGGLGIILIIVVILMFTGRI
jgi:hypothetical protein